MEQRINEVYKALLNAAKRVHNSQLSRSDILEDLSRISADDYCELEKCTLTKIEEENDKEPTQ